MQNEPTKTPKPVHMLPRVGKHKRSVAYVWFFHQPYVLILLMIPALVVFLTPIRYMTFLSLIMAFVVFKSCGSLRLYPLFTNLKIDERFVYLSINVNSPLRKFSLEEIYITEARYNGLRYILFSPAPVPDTFWYTVAHRKDVIAYPFCKGMKVDFPELFQYIPFE